MPREDLHPDQSTRQRKNAYWCETCNGYIVTIDVDKGVTPMFLACRVKGDPRDPGNDCKGTSRSMMYPAEPWPEEDGFGNAIPTEPTWEWYSPSATEFKRLRRSEPGTYEHVRKGGLLLRRRAALDETQQPRGGRVVMDVGMKLPVRGPLRLRLSSLVYENMAGPFVVERIEVMGEFASREAARQYMLVRQYMLDTEDERADEIRLREALEWRDQAHDALQALSGCIPASWKNGNKRQRDAYEKLTKVLYG